jgi:methenyltetrahydrofolate cyclohydrolase
MSDSEELASAPLASRPLRRLLAEVAAATPAPGGGCSAGWTLALSASLVEMVAGIARERLHPGDGGERFGAIAARARSLREHAIELAERDLHAYEAVLAALRTPSDEPDRAERLDGALSEAAETPLALARVGEEVAALGLEAAQARSSHLRGDALAGVLLAEGACQAAARLVQINLAGRPEDPRLVEVAEVCARAASLRIEALR